MTITTRSPEETEALGLRLGRLLRPGDLVCLAGELGAGKTTLVRGLARGVGCRGRVMSPTFGLMRVYKGPGRVLYHLDLYRVAPGETRDIGIEECLADPKGLCVVEWPASGGPYWRRDRLEARLTHVPGGRRLAFKASGTRSRAVLRGLRRPAGLRSSLDCRSRRRESSPNCGRPQFGDKSGL